LTGSFQDRKATLHWAIRDTDPENPEWISAGGEERVTRREIGMGYDEVADAFVLAAISSSDYEGAGDPHDLGFPGSTDGVPWILLFDAETGDLNEHLVLKGTIVHSIGKPACHDTNLATFVQPTHCALPVGTSEARGPKLGVAYFGLQDDLIDSSVVPTDPAIQSFEIVSLSTADVATGVLGTGSEDFVGSLVGVDAQDPFFATFATRARVPAVIPADTPTGWVGLVQAALEPAPGEVGGAVVPEWPVAIGSQSNGSMVTYSAWRVVPDQPDGGDEDEDTGGGSNGNEDSDGSGGGGGSDDGGDGCNCRTGSASPSPILALFAVAWGIRRRRV
jgi:MYXO-CTERM domain-containing protein